MELHDQFNPETIIATQTVNLDVNGNAAPLFPASVIGGAYYIAIHNRNAIETWSRMPVTMGPITVYDFKQ